MGIDVETQIIIDRPREEVAAFAAHFLGRRLDYEYEVSAFVPGERLVMGTTDGPLAMETTYEWRAAGEGTRMTLRNRGEPSGFPRLFAPLMSAAVRRANRKDLERLKSTLEPKGV
jgi:hypothetical protein